MMEFSIIVCLKVLCGVQIYKLPTLELVFFTPHLAIGVQLLTHTSAFDKSREELPQGMRLPHVVELGIYSLGSSHTPPFLFVRTLTEFVFNRRECNLLFKLVQSNYFSLLFFTMTRQYSTMATC
jgi:hypothetical protein